MPEGDTLHKLAIALRRELVGKKLTRLFLRDQGAIDPAGGSEVTSVEAIGKHLLIAADVGFTLRIHLGMHGEVRGFRHPHRAPFDANAVLETDDAMFVCRNAAQAELIKTDALDLHPALARLGPDLAVDGVDFADVVRRARERADRGIGEVLLDQSVACGIGNVFKSEVCFLERIHPFKTLSAIDDAKLEAVYRRASELLQRNVRPGKRITTEGTGVGSHYVYERNRRPCRRCAMPIERRLQGEQARSTYFCPRCQPA